MGTDWDSREIEEGTMPIRFEAIGPLVPVANRLMVAGALLAALGAIAWIHLALATLATVYVVAALMFAGGIGQLLHISAANGGHRTLGWLLTGALYLSAACVIVLNPLLAARLLTLMLCVFLSATGLARIWIAAKHKLAGWGWMLLSGWFSLIMASIIAIGWPEESLWIVGLLLAIDLLLQGFMLSFCGLTLRWSTD